MKKPLKLLVNAEPFGFGPTAAMADFFPFLRKNFEHLAFIGGDHCLDLHSGLNYDAIFDITNKKETGNSFKKIVSEYDLFFTACNFRRALIAHSLGIPTLLYDPLSWYWKDIPKQIGNEILYIAQDFYGVRELIEGNPQRFQNYKIVPPIAKKIRSTQNKNLVFVNLGGVQNPYWSLELSTEYAAMMIRALRSVIPATQEVIIATSKSVSFRLNDPQVRTYSRDEIESLLLRTKYAAMTPGLANIHTSACHNIPTLFLPPANDSQGLQLDTIRQHNLLDEGIDWFQIRPEKIYDYKGNQLASLAAISDALIFLKSSDHAMNTFTQLCAGSIERLNNSHGSALTKMIEIFGSGGAESVAEIVTDYAKRI